MKHNSMIRIFSKYVSLNVLGMIGLSCYILADTFFVSNALGTNGLTALNLAISVYSIIHGTGLMLGIGVATKYAVLKAQNKEKDANSFFNHTFILGIITGILFLLVGLFFSTPLSKLLGADNETLIMTSTYISVILGFSPFFIINNILLAFIRNDKNPKLSMIAMIVGSLSNIILDYIFVFPLSMGMFGAAFATGLAPIISIGVLSIHFIKKKNNFTLTRCKLNIFKIKSIFSLGISTFITEISSAVVLIMFNLTILRLAGNIGVAAYGIVANISLVAISVFTGIAQGVQPLASKSYGKHDSQNLINLIKYSFILSLSLAVIIYGITIFMSNNIIAVFNSENNEELLNYAKNGFILYFIGFFFAGINIVTSAFLSATEQPKTGFIVSITRGCLAIIPLVLILPNIFGMTGVWISFTLAELISCIIAVKFILLQKKTILKNQNPDLKNKELKINNPA